MIFQFAPNKLFNIENLNPVRAENKAAFFNSGLLHSVFTRLFNSSIVKKFLCVSACFIGSILSVQIGIANTRPYKLALMQLSAY